ncbi:hypothetical protein FIV42_05780 [Persicimonas caeni]|uniref:YkgJ family cysteine cluster protein n=1 Tax=Persicimonas caeni TaxID=2292766 RepID=A0A4Y6PPI3_PERCE|nr:hypothetical protein [Persicimonas caeni]QDG50256.1 hypothetical protein FIV42_05780 [Persicimonas caeni]QED31477.1 hypothetical protein FRD00_05775 [Persicimonas caeni]
MSSKPHDVLIDCEEGRALGCATFCCRLLVRLDPDEREVGPDGRERRFIEKRPEDGLCIYCDPENHRCTRWETRPRVCREYDCNQDKLLQVVLRDGFTSLSELVTADKNFRGCPPVCVPPVDEES